MSFHASRVVYIRASGPDGEVRADGYALSGRLILTIATPILKATKVEVRHAMGIDQYKGTILWARTGINFDAALILLDRPRAYPSSVYFGACEDDVNILFKNEGGGTLKAKDGRYNLLPKSLKPHEQPRPGAPLFVGGLLVGVISKDRLWATPLESIAKSGIFRRVVKGRPIFRVDRTEAELRAKIDSAMGSVERAEGLTALGNILSAAGRLEEGYAVTSEAANIFQAQINRGDSDLLVDRASTLSNLVGYLRALDRTEEAIKTGRAAVNLYRDLAKNDPAQFLPELARNLSNLGILQSDTPDDSFETISEALDLYRTLSKERGGIFDHELANTLLVMGQRLGERDRFEDALTHLEEAVSTLTKLYKQQPDTFALDLALALGARGRALEAADKPKEALISYARGMLTLGRLAERPVEPFRGAAKAFKEGAHRLFPKVGSTLPEDLRTVLSTMLGRSAEGEPG